MSQLNKGLSSPGVDNATLQPDSFAKKTTEAILSAGKVITTDPSSAPVYVGKGNLVRLLFSAKAWVAFGPQNPPPTAPASSSSNPGLEIPASTYVVVAATDDMMIASSNPSRFEVRNG